MKERIMGKGCIKGRLRGDDRTGWDKRSYWQELLRTRKIQNKTGKNKPYTSAVHLKLGLVHVIVYKWPHLQTQHKREHKRSIMQQPTCDFWIDPSEVNLEIQGWIKPLWCNVQPAWAGLGSHLLCFHIQRASFNTAICVKKKAVQVCFPSSLGHWGTALFVHC